MTGTACANDCLYDDIEIGLFVMDIIGLVHKLLDDIGILLGEALANLGTRIF